MVAAKGPETDRERIVRLETLMSTMSESVGRIEKTVDGIAKDVAEVKADVLPLKAGAAATRRVLWLIAGALISAVVGTVWLFIVRGGLAAGT